MWALVALQWVLFAIGYRARSHSLRWAVAAAMVLTIIALWCWLGGWGGLSATEVDFDWFMD